MNLRPEQPNCPYKFSVKLTQVQKDPETWDITCLVCGIAIRRHGSLLVAVNTADLHATSQHGFGIDGIQLETNP